MNATLNATLDALCNTYGAEYTAKNIALCLKNVILQENFDKFHRFTDLELFSNIMLAYKEKIFNWYTNDKIKKYNVFLKSIKNVESSKYYSIMVICIYIELYFKFKKNDTDKIYCIDDIDRFIILINNICVWITNKKSNFFAALTQKIKLIKFCNEYIIYFNDNYGTEYNACDINKLNIDLLLTNKCNTLLKISVDTILKISVDNTVSSTEIDDMVLSTVDCEIDDTVSSTVNNTIDCEIDDILYTTINASDNYTNLTSAAHAACGIVEAGNIYTNLTSAAGSENDNNTILPFDMESDKFPDIMFDELNNTMLYKKTFNGIMLDVDDALNNVMLDNITIENLSYNDLLLF